MIKCECCGANITEISYYMYTCDKCFSTYIVDDSERLLFKYITTDGFRSLLSQVLGDLVSSNEKRKETAIRRLLLEYQDVPALWNTLGVICRGRNNLEEAQKCYTMALKMNPKYGVVFMNRSVLNYNLNDLNAAYDDAEKALLYIKSPDPNYGKLLGNYALLVGKKGDIDRADELLEEATKNGYRNSDVIRGMLGIKKKTVPLGESAKGFFAKLKGGINSYREDAAVRKAYRVEEEKRKPHIKRVQHERPLTPQEQQTVDLLEAEMNAMMGKASREGKSFWEALAMTNPIQMKVDEIKNRAIWVEEITIPPEIDPNIPITIDEEAIRRSVRKL